MVLIEGASRSYPGRFTAAYLRRTEGTKVLRERADGTRELVSFDDLKVGQRVQGWAASWDESDPVEGDAETLVILYR